ncbi:MAG: DUF2125 domain-containing protein [Pseudomonadota bacterium]
MAPRSRSAIKNIRQADKRRQAEASKDDWNADKNQRRVYWFGGAIVFVVLFLTGSWFFVASRVDGVVTQELEALNTPGQTVTCMGQEIVGFPFRMGLQCDEIEFTSQTEGVTVQAGTLRTTAQVYAPRLQIIDLASPLRISSDNALPLELNWDSARSSVRINGANTLQRVVLEVANLTVTTALPDTPSQQLVSLTKLFSVAEPFSLDESQGGTGDQPDLRMFLQGDAIMPRGLSMPPINFEGTLALDGGAALLTDADQWLAALPSVREPIRLEGVTLRTGGTLVELSGRLSVTREGLLNGTIRMAGQRLEEGLTELQNGIDPRNTALKQTVDTLVPAILALAQPDADNPAIRNAPPIIFRNGRVVLGILPLGDIPPIRLSR